MDIGMLLPLLMGKSDGTNNEKMNSLLKLAQGEKPDINAVMNMAMAQKQKSPYYGLKAVAGIASCEILGKLAGFFL